MSRGPGRIMRAVLADLHEHAEYGSFDPEYWTSGYVIAWCIARDDLQAELGQKPNAGDVVVTASLRESVRRAIVTLARDGRVETTQLWHHDSREWSGIHCRLSPQELDRLSVGDSPTLNPVEASTAVEALRDAIDGLAS